jgi:hypothetical protein
VRKSDIQLEAQRDKRKLLLRALFPWLRYPSTHLWPPVEGTRVIYKLINGVVHVPLTTVAAVPWQDEITYLAVCCHTSPYLPEQGVQVELAEILAPYFPSNFLSSQITKY